MSEPGPDQLREQARKYAWGWFTVHAAQRMQTFNFFLVATAFLFTAYGALLEKHAVAAAIVALVGAWFAFWFTRLDARTKQLVKASERALKVLEAQLAERSGVPELTIVEAVEKPEAGTSSYGVVISVVEWTIVGVFVLAAAYAICAKHA